MILWREEWKAAQPGMKNGTEQWQEEWRSEIQGVKGMNGE
ncbi:hypothetical protein NPIL_79151, partial [Nephila pilipes]